MTKPVCSPLSGSVSTDPYLTVAEIAAAMRVSTMTIYRLIHSGELDAAQVGASFRVRLSALQAAIAGTAAVPAPAQIRARPALGQTLKAARTAAGCTQAQLATKMGSAQSSISRAEREGYGDREFWEAADRTLGMGGTLVKEFDQMQRRA